VSVAKWPYVPPTLTRLEPDDPRGGWALPSWWIDPPSATDVREDLNPRPGLPDPLFTFDEVMRRWHRSFYCDACGAHFDVVMGGSSECRACGSHLTHQLGKEPRR
jgi:hypothetical protein